MGRYAANKLPTTANALWTPTLGPYQPTALRAVAPPLLPGLRGVVDFTLSTRVPVRVALPRRVCASQPGVCTEVPRTVRMYGFTTPPRPRPSQASPAPGVARGSSDPLKGQGHGKVV